MISKGLPGPSEDTLILVSSILLLMLQLKSFFSLSVVSSFKYQIRHQASNLKLNEL